MTIIGNDRPKRAICVAVIVLLSTSLVLAYAPDPDNAALLYYQAFLLYERADEATSNALRDVSQGKKQPDERITEYVEGCHTAIELAAAASEIPNCNWGLKYSDGFSAHFPHLAQSRHLCFLVGADARILAADGAYRQALDRCLTIYRMSRHVGDETIISFLVSGSLKRFANGCVQDILGDMPPDAASLKWLRNRLVDLSSKQPSPQAALKLEQEIVLESMTLEGIEELVHCLMPDCNETDLERLRGLDEDVIEKNRDYYANYMALAQEALSASKKFEEIYIELKKLDEQLKDVAEEPAAALAVAVVPAVWKIYTNDIRTKTYSNAIRTALDIYLVKARTGELPDKLPEGLPKDLFSGQDFEYERTKDGFVLRCRAKDLEKDEIHRYEFKVRK